MAQHLSSDLSKTSTLTKISPSDTVQAQDDMSSHAPVQEGLTEYEVTIHTADILGAGTDADVSLSMIGTAGNDDKLHECWPIVNDNALCNGCQAGLHTCTL